MQSRLFFAIQAGQCQLPSIDEMKKEADAVEERLANRYVSSPRHTIQVKCFWKCVLKFKKGSEGFFKFQSVNYHQIQHNSKKIQNYEIKLSEYIF